MYILPNDLPQMLWHLPDEQQDECAAGFVGHLLSIHGDTDGAWLTLFKDGGKFADAIIWVGDLKCLRWLLWNGLLHVAIGDERAPLPVTPRNAHLHGLSSDDAAGIKERNLLMGKRRNAVLFHLCLRRTRSQVTAVRQRILRIDIDHVEESVVRAVRGQLGMGGYPFISTPSFSSTPENRSEHIFVWSQCGVLPDVLSRCYETCIAQMFPRVPAATFDMALARQTQMVFLSATARPGQPLDDLITGADAGYADWADLIRDAPVQSRGERRCSYARRENSGSGTSLDSNAWRAVNEAWPKPPPVMAFRHASRHAIALAATYILACEGADVTFVECYLRILADAMRQSDPKTTHDYSRLSAMYQGTMRRIAGGYLGKSGRKWFHAFQ